MTLEVAAGTTRRMHELRDQCLLRIVHSDDAAAASSVLEGLAKIAHEAASSDAAVAFVSEVMKTPDGPMILIDARGLRDTELDQILGGLVQRADEIGLSSGRLEVPKGGRLVRELEAVDRAVIGAALPPPDRTRVVPPGSIPERWRDVAAGWLRTGELEPLVVEVVAVEAPIAWGDLDAYLGIDEHRHFRVSSGTVRDGLRTIVGNVVTNTRLSFMAAGRTLSSDRICHEADALRQRLHACRSELAYGYATPVGDVRRFGMGEIDVPGAVGSYPGGANRSLTYLSNIQVLDAFWYQILGPGHLERLGSLPGASDIGEGKVELVLGEFEEWLDPDRASVLRQLGRSLLEPCFLSKEEAREILSERRRVQ